jgi:hypothetical protein
LNPNYNQTSPNKPQKQVIKNSPSSTSQISFLADVQNTCQFHEN